MPCEEKKMNKLKSAGTLHFIETMLHISRKVLKLRAPLSCVPESRDGMAELLVSQEASIS